MDYTILGARIRQERQKHNLTQEKLAEKIDVSHAYIGQIEREERSLTLDTLVKISNQLAVTVDYLLSEAIEHQDKYYINKINQVMLNRSLEDQKLILEMIELMFAHMDKGTRT
ncbi:helix-turn-helix domain-containing protein [Paenibacillus sp. sgz302251]|uniref:helix-turn-helix domain-containing protein n=1 Tax=Paenibacillus sp. sgz302251 TaxID=3414493 RepID=UPI003C7D5E80